MTGARADEATRRPRIAWSKQHDSEFQRAGRRGAEGSAGDYIVWSSDRAWPMDDRDFTLTFDVNGRKTPYLDGLVYPAVSTVAGQPAPAFPVGRSREGLPIGLQAIGPYLEDRTPIRFASLVGREFGGFTKPPGYDQ